MVRGTRTCNQKRVERLLYKDGDLIRFREAFFFFFHLQGREGTWFFDSGLSNNYAPNQRGNYA